ncbi:MAG: hypothetical protein HYV19_11115 [Gemmatimonadetes bacterium]|nr:hypothetical protein [Gemmatimonadota bacterium]
MRRWRFVLAMLVAGIAGCSLPFIGGKSHTVTPAVPAATAVPAAPAAPPIVQVRGFWRSSVVSVVAWDLEDAQFGLRTEVSRTGRLVGGARLGDHSVYITPFFAWYLGGFRHAYIVPGRPLLPVGGNDIYACFYGVHCSPMAMVGVRVPDSLLRANRDSLVVTFVPASQDPWTITLRRELITAYLTAVDSVVAERQKVSAR